MKYSISRKTLALGMTLLFLGTIFVPIVSGDIGSSEPTLSNKASSNTGGEPSSTTSKASRTGSTSFTYGPLGNRISSTDANSDTTYYLYEGTNVIQDRMSDGTLAREYVSGIGSKLAMIDHTDDGNQLTGEDEILYYLHDILGSVVVLIDENGNGCERYYYDPYGETVITDETGNIERDESLFGNTYMWTGQRYDPENELYYFPARSYSPSLGRWLQRDPLGYVDGLNLYEYVRSNPMRFVDTLGTFGTESKWKGQMKARYPELTSVVDRSSKEVSEGTLGTGDIRLMLRKPYKIPRRSFISYFWENIVDTVRDSPAEAIVSAHVDLSGENQDLGWGDALSIMLFELPARNIFAREASVSGLEGRNVDYGFFHSLKIWAAHHAGIDSMVDGLNGWDLTSRQKLDAVDRISSFSAGLSQYAAISAAFSTPTLMAINKVRLSIAMRRVPNRLGSKYYSTIVYGLEQANEATELYHMIIKAARKGRISLDAHQKGLIDMHFGKVKRIEALYLRNYYAGKVKPSDVSLTLSH